MSKSDARIPLNGYIERSDDVLGTRAADFFEEMARRRTVREFSDRPIPAGVIEDCIRTAGTAPSGANQQPWHFAVVRDARLKQTIREAAEREEREFYGGRAPAEWLTALAEIGTDWQKPFLESAPCLIAIFQLNDAPAVGGGRVKHYYAKESVGLATGLLIVALHHAGLVTLTHTPSPMGFLNTILGRPKSEKPFLLLVVGFPAAGVTVPNLHRKGLEDIASFY